jgi:hypothetical protein
MMTFEQYAYQMMITADGTNVQGALDAQRQQFQGMQDANRTRQDAFNDYMAAMRRNSDATGRAVDNWDRTTLRGQGQYSGPDGNGSQWVPNQGPAGQPFGWGGNQYVQDQQGPTPAAISEIEPRRHVESSFSVSPWCLCT